jgi:serine/threonine protein kinase
MSVPFAPDTLLMGRYQIKSAIGEGGIGQVWLATDTEDNDSPVAIKIPKPAYRSQARFIAEAELMARLDHPNIIQIFQMGRHETLGEYYVMEYYQDGSLIDFLLSGQCDFVRPVPKHPELRYIPLAEIINILRPIAQGLDYVHQYHPGVLHRDFKLSNILVDRETNRYVLTDFSLHLGAPAVMSPEQLREWKEPASYQPPVDWRSDLYAFGACLFKLTTGAYPFPVSQTNPMLALDEIYRYQLVDKLPVDLPSHRNPANPDLQNETVNNLIHQLTSKSRNGRTMNGRIKRLEDVLDMLEQASTVKKGWVTPLFATVVLVLALLLLAGGLVVGSLQTTNADDEQGQRNQGNQVVVFTTQAALSGYPTATPTAGSVALLPVTPTEVQPEAETETTAAGPTSSPDTPEPDTIAEPSEPGAPLPVEGDEPDTPEDNADAETDIAVTGELTDTAETSSLTCDAGLELLNPQLNQTVSDQVIFQGLISQADLDYYKVEYLPPDGEQWSCCLVDPTYESASPENLGQWDTTNPRFAPGRYQVRLVAVKLDGNFTVCETRVTVEK